MALRYNSAVANAMANALASEVSYGIEAFGGKIRLYSGDQPAEVGGTAGVELAVFVEGGYYWQGLKYLAASNGTAALQDPINATSGTIRWSDLAGTSGTIGWARIETHDASGILDCGCGTAATCDVVVNVVVVKAGQKIGIKKFNIIQPEG